MGRWSVILLVLVLVLGGVSAADAEPTRRVVLADPDPELARAVTSALSPWHFEIVVDPAPVPDTTRADARARASDARFVVWRRRGDLVVYDRSRGAAEFRDGKAGALDPTDAAAAALTVKTLMRLPPPDREKDIVAPPVKPTTVETLRIQIGLGARLAESASGGRAMAMVMWRPTQRPWRIGLAADVGPSGDISEASFRGDARELGLAAVGSWQVPFGRYAVEPFVGIGARRLTLDGQDGGDARQEASTFASVHVGVWGQLVAGSWVFGPVLAVDVIPAAPSFARAMGNGTVYEAPGFAMHVGVFAALGI